MFRGVCFLAASLLADRTGLVLLFATCGLFGGVMAAAVKSGDGRPSLWVSFNKSVTGLVMGLLLGFVGMGNLGYEEKQVCWTAAACVVGGFVGPLWAWKTLSELYPRVPGPPPPPDPKPKQGDSP